VAHEADHYWRHLDGECDLAKGNCPEDAAEEFALEELRVSEGLNTHTFGRGSEKRMVSKGEIMGIYGASLVSKGVDKVLVWADTQYPTGFMGYPTSFWGNAALGIIPPVAHLVMKKPLVKGKYQLPMYVISANAAANVAEDLYEKFMAPAPVARVRRTAVPRSSPQLTNSTRVRAF
jgi:hypothetical protein